MKRKWKKKQPKKTQTLALLASGLTASSVLKVVDFTLQIDDF